MAHARQLLLHLRLGELRRIDVELAVEQQLLDHVPLARRQIEVGVQRDLARPSAACRPSIASRSRSSIRPS